MSAPGVAARLDAVRERIAIAAKRAGRGENDVQLVAASKTVEPARIVEAFDAGQRVFGENRAQELTAHANAVDRDAVWHFVGRLQRNKVRSVARFVSCWESVDRDELVDEIAKHAPGASVFVQVNLGDEPQKGGCAPAGAAALVDTAQKAGLGVEGLMTVPPAGVDPRPYFATLRTLGGQLELHQLSMGMSGDFEAAIEEGATIVRIGSAVFGPRSTSENARR
jgi:PLP dependent protein